MSKLGWAIAVVGGAGLLTYVVVTQKGGAGGEAPIAGLLPSSTVFYLEVPDLKASTARFKETALAKLSQEPEIRAFLEKPLTQIPNLPDTQSTEWQKLDPQHSFIALTSIENMQPRLIFGVKYAGQPEALDAVLTKLRSTLKEKYPTGKFDIQRHEGDEVETFTSSDDSFAATRVDQWLFVANQEGELKQLLNRYRKRDAEGEPLSDNAVFKATVNEVNQFDKSDLRGYAHLLPLWKIIADMSATQGTPLSADELKRMNDSQAMAGIWRMDGELMREEWFVYAPAAPKFTPLSADTYSLTTENAIVVYNGKFDPTALPEAKLKPFEGFINPSAIVNLLNNGIEPWLTLNVDWPKDQEEAQFWIGGSVRDVALMREKTGEAFPALQASEENGVSIWTFATTGVPFAPSLGLTEKHWLITLQKASFDAALTRSREQGKTILDNATFQAAAKTLRLKVEDSLNITYVDLPQIIGRSYDKVRPMLPILIALSPDASKVIDPAKLPTTETLVRHIRPLIATSHQTANGVTIESTGTLTLLQSVLPVGVALGVTQYISKQTQGE